MSQNDQLRETPKREEQKDDARDSGLGRRDALKKVGRYAAYTAPAVLALLLSKDASGY